MEKLTIEISYTLKEGECPEHYGYYDDFEDAMDGLKHLEDILIEAGDEL